MNASETVLRVEVSLDEARLIQSALVYMQTRTAPDSVYREKEDGSFYESAEFDLLRGRFT